jgi:hypothetical protein
LSVLIAALAALQMAIGDPRDSVPKETGWWLWSGRSLSKAPGSLLYVHQATVDKKGTVVFSGAGAITVPDAEIYVVVRLDTLIAPKIAASIASRAAARWENRGTRVRGVQIDFDSPTFQLDRYVTFVRALRDALPVRLRLSVTGLADWASQGEESTVRALTESADEVVFQLYTGRSPVKNLDSYCARLAARNVPFKIGLLPGMDELPAVRSLLGHPAYRGTVYFLLDHSRA